ncbi:MAG: hypothetical protein ACAI43_02420 [Phycisphaerae bacterium]|nr:hypothetical protein [Tepidisphaeraceae bacterium]
MSAFISRAISLAIWFSKPSSLRLVKGKLFGSAAMRSTRLGDADTPAAFG